MASTQAGGSSAEPERASKQIRIGRLGAKEASEDMSGSVPASTSSPAVTNGTAGRGHPKPGVDKKATSSRSRGRTKSFFTKIVQAFVPCTGPSHAHAAVGTDDINDTEDSPGNSLALKEKRAALERNNPLLETFTPHQPQPRVDTPVPDDAEVILPPPVALLPMSETDGVTSGAVQAPGSTGDSSALYDHLHKIHQTEDSDGGSFDEFEGPSLDEEDEEARLIRNGGSGIPIGPDGKLRPLLPPILSEHIGRKCLVLDLDETLVHSSFKVVQGADFVVPVEIDRNLHSFYILKRPGVDEFLRQMGLVYEVVVFTASLGVYADPVLDKLDIHRAVTHRLFRESCYNHKGNYVKDLSQLGRPMGDCIILDNSPASYLFHPHNAVPVSSWFNDPHDSELGDMAPFLKDLRHVGDVRAVLDGGL